MPCRSDAGKWGDWEGEENFFWVDNDDTTSMEGLIADFGIVSTLTASSFDS